MERRAQRAVTPQSGKAGGSLSKVLLGLTLAGVLGVVALAVVLLREGDRNPSVADQFAENDPGPVHIHGLGINPADRSLFIATHTGTWRVANGTTKAERVGDNYQDTMGFTVVGPNRFLGSGHPATADQPPLLGLIESDDAGKTWEPVTRHRKAISSSGSREWRAKSAASLAWSRTTVTASTC